MAAAPAPSTASLRAHLRVPRRALAQAIALVVVATALPLAGPQLLRAFVDRAIAGTATSTLLGLAGAYLAVAVGGQLVLVAATWAAGRLAWSSTNQLREVLMAHVLGLDLSFHGRHTAGELIERIDGDVSALSDFLARFVLQVVGSGLLLTGTVVLVWREDARVGAALSAFLAVAAVAVLRMQRLAVPAAQADREATAQKFGVLEERIVAAEDLRALGAAQHALDQLDAAQSSEFHTHKRWQVVSGGLLAATNLLFATGTALLLGLGVLLQRAGTLTVGSVLLLLQYSVLVRRPIEQLTGQFKELQLAAAGAARVRELLAERATITDPPGGGRALPAGPMAVRLDHVTFAYPGDPAVLHDVVLELPAGRSLGLVGRTGSGKTTIARLLLRLLDPMEGVVELGGVELRRASLASVRRHVRLVTQDVQLFGADLRDNLTLFTGGVDDDRLAEVLHDLGLGPWFDRLPAGLDSRLGPGGDAGVSAGEAQLLAFARVFLADPGLVVLDEATSRLDPATEALIERAVARLLEGRTAVVIAHRLSTLDRVDDIAVLDHGRVVEHGPRAQLAAEGTGRFAHLLAAAEGGVPA